ncbi:MAG: integrase arm-type DNA-binding domain-containing protein [Rhodopila sp.]
MSDRFARKLTDASVRNARPKVKPYKMADGGDLCLLVQPNGARLWQYKFRTNGREGVQALGVYPDVSLASAHVANQAAVADGVNPVRKRRVDRQEADALRLDASRIAVAGDCSGGNMAAAVAMLAKQRRGPEITFQLLLYPTVAGPTPFESAPGDQRATD